jgi:hypothetical protein
MTKHFAITNLMRNQLADQLTAQAIAQSGPAIATRLQAMNAIFWREHIDRVAALPGLEKSQWSALIQAGAVTAVSTCVPTTKIEEGAHFYNREFLKFSYSDRQDREKALLKLILASPAFSGVADLVTKSERSSNSYSLRFKSTTGAVPRTHSLSDIPSDHPIVIAGRKIQTELEELLGAAAVFREQVIDVLVGCRSSRQVAELFPEAALLLPQPVTKEQHLAPVELIASVRKALSNGFQQQHEYQ